MRRMLLVIGLVAGVAGASAPAASAWDIGPGYVPTGDSNLSCGEAQMISEFFWDSSGFGDNRQTDLLKKDCLSKPSPSSMWLKGGDIWGRGVGVWKCLLDWDAGGIANGRTMVGCNRQ